MHNARINIHTMLHHCICSGFFELSFLRAIQIAKLIDYVNKSKDPSLFQKKIPFLYFILGLTNLRYQFAFRLYKAPTPSDEIIKHFPNYRALRTISNIAFGTHVAMGIIIISVNLIVWIF